MLKPFLEREDKMLRNVFIMTLKIIFNVSLILAQGKYTIKEGKIDDKPIKMKINKKSKSIHRIYGSIELNLKNQKINSQNIKSIVNGFLKDNKDLLKVDPKCLKLRTLDNRKNRWHINYQQFYKNIPVYSSYLGLAVDENGQIISLGSETFFDIYLEISQKIDKKDALEIAQQEFSKLSSIKFPEIKRKPELTILPLEMESGYDYYLTYKIELEFIDSTSVFSQVYFIDANNGSILKEFSNIRNSDLYGTVKLFYFPKHNYDNPVLYDYWEGGKIKLYNYLGQYVGERTTNSSGYYVFSGIGYGNYSLTSNINSTNLSNSYVSIDGMNHSYESSGVPGNHS